MKAKMILCLSFMLGIATLAVSQTQNGYVKTTGRLENGKLVHGRIVAEATIQIKGRSAVLSRKDGTFSFSIKEKNYIIENVIKQGYTLVDRDVLSRQHSYSANPLVILMADQKELDAYRRSIEHSVRNKLYGDLQKKSEELEALRYQNRITEEKYHELVQRINNEYDENEKIVKDMADMYTKIDFDSVDEFQRRVSDCIIQGRLAEADSLIRSKGSFEKRKAQLDQLSAANAAKRQELTRSEAMEITLRDNLAQDYYNIFNLFKMQHKTDSAAKYIELRAALDTNNILWQAECGMFMRDYVGNYNSSLFYFLRCLNVASKEKQNDNSFLSDIYSNIGMAYYYHGNYEEALKYHNQALMVQKKSLGDDHIDVATSYNNLGIVNLSLGNHDKAMDFFNKALKIAESKSDKEYSKLVLIYANIGEVYLIQGQYDKALELYTKASQLQESQSEIDNPTTSSLYDAIGKLYSILGDLDKSMIYYEKALEIQNKILVDNHPSKAYSFFGIGNNYYRKRDYNRALGYLNKALMIFEQNLDENHPDMAAVYGSIGNIYEGLRDYDKALENYNKSLAIEEKIYGKDHPAIAYAFMGISNVYEGLGNYDMAKEYLFKALLIEKKQFGNDHPDIASIYRDLGNLNKKQTNYDTSLVYFNKALNVKIKNFGEEYTEVADIYSDMGEVYYRKGDYKKSLNYYFKAKEIEEKVLGMENKKIATTYNNIAFVYDNMGDFESSLDYYNRVLIIRDKLYGQSSQQYLQALKSVTTEKYKIFVMKGKADQFCVDHCFIATVSNNDSPAKQQGLEGEYILLELADWTQDSQTSIFEKNAELRGKPKSIVVMKNGVISKHFFDNSIGAQLGVKYVGAEEKQRINKLYEAWKKKNTK